MERSLSVLLPVRNLEATLANAVLEKLEVFSELTRRAELVLIDDGSEDATGEVADSLADAYPQVRSVHHNHARGRTAAIASGVQASRSEVLFLEDADCRLPIHEVRRLWELLDRYELVLGRPSDGGVSTDKHIHLHRHISGSLPSPHQSLTGNDAVGPHATIRRTDFEVPAPSSRIRQLHACSSQASPDQEGLHDGYLLARRWILEALHGTVAHGDEILRYLAERRIPWHEVSIDRRMETPIPRRIGAGSPPSKSVHWIDSWESTRADRTLFASALRKAMGNSQGR